MLPTFLSLSVAIVLPSFATRVRAQATVGISCFAYDGQAYPNHTICPGSNSCCNYEATCLSNRLCHNIGDPPDLFVRGPCSLETWDSTCPQICLYCRDPANRYSASSVCIGRSVADVHPQPRTTIAACSRGSRYAPTAATAATTTRNAARAETACFWMRAATSSR